MKNIFIVIEGIDGCGKGEQIKRLQNYFFEKDKRNIVLTTREPTYGNYGMRIRQILRDDKDPLHNAELMLELYTKDRKEHLDTLILPFLARKTGEINHILLCDRYYHSTYAFQQTQGIPFEKIHDMEKDFKKPNITFILDVSPETALSRISSDRNGSEKFEKIEFMQDLRDNYLKLKEQLKEKIYIVDASKSREDVFNNILNSLKENNLD